MKKAFLATAFLISSLANAQLFPSDGESFVADAKKKRYTLEAEVYTWTEKDGKKLLNYSSSEQGFKSWYMEGYKQYFRDYRLHGCSDRDVSAYHFTDCMIRALFDSAERSLKELNLDVKFEYTVQQTGFYGYPKCDPGKPNCVHEIAKHHRNKKYKKPLQIVLIPTRNDRSESHTRTYTDGSAVSVLQMGKRWAVSSLHLFRHELAHAMGFNGHLYFDFTFNKNKKTYPKCNEVLVKSYANSGLKRDCANNTFVGHHLPKGRTCYSHSMRNQKFFTYKYAAPYYSNYFRYIFQCYLDASQDRAPEKPKPAPKPEPKPELTDDPYCEHWLNYVTCEHPTLVKKCPVICGKAKK